MFGQPLQAWRKRAERDSLGLLLLHGSELEPDPVDSLGVGGADDVRQRNAATFDLTFDHGGDVNIPEENIHGLTYLWWHPNLGKVSGGIWAFQGIKPCARLRDL